MIKKGQPEISCSCKYQSEQKLNILMRAFITSQLNYCPLIWMFHNRTLNNKINKSR